MTWAGGMGGLGGWVGGKRTRERERGGTPAFQLYRKEAAIGNGLRGNETVAELV